MAKNNFNDKIFKDELLDDEQLDQITGGRQIPNIPFSEKSNIFYNQYGNHHNRPINSMQDKRFTL